MSLLDFTGIVDETITIKSGKTGHEFVLRDDVPVSVYMAMVESQIRNEELQAQLKDKPFEAARLGLEEMKKNLDLLRKIFESNGISLTAEQVEEEFDLKAQQRILNVFFNSPARGSSGTSLLQRDLSQGPSAGK